VCRKLIAAKLMSQTDKAHSDALVKKGSKQPKADFTPLLSENDDDISRLAERILELTNNHPNPNTDIAAPVGFSRMNNKRPEKLTT